VQDVAGNTGSGSTDSNNYAIDTLVPVATSVSVPAAALYSPGDTLTFVVNTNEAVFVSGMPRLAITIGSETVFADYVSGSGSNALVFQYSIQAGNSAANGIAVGSELDANGSSLRDAAGNNIATALSNIGSTSGVVVDGVAPGASIVIDGPSPTQSSTLTFTVRFDEDVSGVDLADFTLSSSGTARGNLLSLIQLDAQTYQVKVGGVTGQGALGLTLGAAGSNIVDAAGNALLQNAATEGYTINADNGDPEFRTSTGTSTPPAPSSPLLPGVPGLPAPISVSPLLPPQLFETPTLGSGIPPLGTIFIGQTSLAPSYIAQVFGNSTGSPSGFLGFGGGDGNLFGTSSLAGIFSATPGHAPLEMSVFGAQTTDLNGGLRGVFGAPTLGQQLHELRIEEQRTVRELAVALQQIGSASPQA